MLKMPKQWKGHKNGYSKISNRALKCAKIEWLRKLSARIKIEKFAKIA